MQINLKWIYGIALNYIGGALVPLLPPNFQWAAWSSLALGIALFAIATLELILNRLKWHFYPTWSFNFGRFSPFAILIPLEKAAQTAYEKLDGTLIATAALKMATPEGPVNYMATSIAHSVPLYGTKPHHKKLKLLPDMEKVGLIKNNGKNSTAIGGQIIIFDNLHISRNDYKKYLHEKLNEHEQR